MNIYVLACVLLGTIFGITSTMVGIHPIAMMLGACAVTLMVTCAILPR